MVCARSRRLGDESVACGGDRELLRLNSRERSQVGAGERGGERGRQRTIRSRSPSPHVHVRRPTLWDAFHLSSTSVYLYRPRKGSQATPRSNQPEEHVASGPEAKM